MKITHEKAKIKVTIEATEHEIQEIINILDEYDSDVAVDDCDCDEEGCTDCFPVYPILVNALMDSIGKTKETIRRTNRRLKRNPNL